MCIGGMRGIPGLLWETSLLDADEGIRFRGHSIPDLQAKLPKAKAGGEPLPEGLLWLLLTGDVPTAQQAAAVTEDLRARSKMPAYVKKVLEALPADAHPMSQLTAGVMALQVSPVDAGPEQQPATPSPSPVHLLLSTPGRRTSRRAIGPSHRVASRAACVLLGEVLFCRSGVPSHVIDCWRWWLLKPRLHCARVPLGGNCDATQCWRFHQAR